jgi:cytochrome b6-f complex iron-sulfur subunit
LCCSTVLEIDLSYSLFLTLYLILPIATLLSNSYLIVKDDKTLEKYGLNAVCTHLGCVVPWSAANNKFMCPCHGSQYAPDGAVVRGPAPLPLALAHCDIDEASDKILFSPWTETDFRTGEKGWWN